MYLLKPGSTMVNLEKSCHFERFDIVVVDIATTTTSNHVIKKQAITYAYTQVILEN